ncbi:MAG TPA: hydantoinase B/oxoprolinase family protein [Acidimicrobiales bacterium]|nr:hydantoinase B/oxoprolinase family protein [Acidimicrobiales bacterium]
MTQTASGQAQATLDPITFEILSSRLAAINDEAAMTMRLVSGSPVANEAYDMNVGLMDAKGDCIAIGMYISIHALALSHTVRELLATYSEDPGIRPGDVFMSNDPYVGACHQMDVVVVAPIFSGSVLVGWTGSTVHQIDLGGPVEGQVQLGATSIWGEQPIFPPVKILDRGEFRRDVEQGYLRRTRLPHLTGLDLKAMIAGCNVAVERVQALIERYGLETVLAAIEGITEATATRFRARLRELPDGTWTHRGYIEYDKVYPVVVSMTKEGDRLVFDFSESAEQAPAVINCTRPACVGATIAAVLPYLCFDMPWSPAGLSKAIDVRTKEGTVVHAAWPAGVSKATTTGSFMATISASVCLAKMLASSEFHLDQFMATWMGGLYVEDVFGVDQRGEFFGAAFLDAMAGGSGARAFADGLDAGGFLDSPSSIIANVEDYEYSYPVLYLYRRIQPDTGGAGKYRGGNTLSMMYVPHDVDRIETKIMHAIGTWQPGSSGIAGGYPSCTNQFVIKRDTNVWALLEEGYIPAELDDLEGDTEIYDESIVKTSQGRHDVYRCVAMGGGGYLDPIERDPDAVARDVANGVLTPRYAHDRYGVVMDGVGKAADLAATEERREVIRLERRASSSIPATRSAP